MTRVEGAIHFPGKIAGVDQKGSGGGSGDGQMRVKGGTYKGVTSTLYIIVQCPLHVHDCAVNCSFRGQFHKDNTNLVLVLGLFRSYKASPLK